MVTISSYESRESNGKNFFVLILQGEVEFVRSQKTGLPYAMVPKCSMPATFDEATCKTMIGKQLPGSIKKVECEPYEYKIPNSKEVVLLDYNYVYTSMENSTIEKAIFEEA
jgi:hypothetical protein